MLKIINNPIDTLFTAFKFLYPEVEKKIKGVVFVNLEDLKNRFSALYEDKGEFTILLSTNLGGKKKMTFEKATEFIAFELSNIVNYNEKILHSTKCEETFRKINSLYCRYRDYKHKDMICAEIFK